MGDDARKVRIYTRTGDQGDTGLFDGTRVSKNDIRVEAFGMLDELSAFLGLTAAAVDDAQLVAQIREIQHDLFAMGADLATPEGERRSRLPRLVQENDWRRLETWMDAYDAVLPPLRAFILPGGNEAAARAHVARVTCRAAERVVVHLTQTEEIRSENLIYLNRLSDFLFICSRYMNHRGGAEEVYWQQRERNGPDEAGARQR